jgi:hypothetical protein
VSAPCRYDELVAARLGINRTDLRCLDLLHETGTMSAGQLAVGSASPPAPPRACSTGSSGSATSGDCLTATTDDA